MKENQQEPAGDLLPRHLSIEEINDPFLVMEKFYDMARLPQARQFMWEMLRAIVTGEYVKLNVKDRVNILYVYEQLQRVLEASYLLYMAHKLSKPGNNSSSC